MGILGFSYWRIRVIEVRITDDTLYISLALRLLTLPCLLMHAVNNTVYEYSTVMCTEGKHFSSCHFSNKLADAWLTLYCLAVSAGL